MTLAKTIFGVVLMGLAIALSAWCAMVHLSPPRGHMSGADISQIIVSGIFILFAPALALGGMALVQYSTKSKMLTIVTWLLLLPVAAALAILLFTIAKNFIDFM